MCVAVLQYLKFLTSSMPLKDYAAVLPPFDQVATRYGLPCEVVFAIYRPLLSSMQPPLSTVAEDGEIQGVPSGGSTQTVLQLKTQEHLA